jgi:formyltetrahydrofolate deformylase
LKDTAILLINCPDAKGIVAAVSNFLYLNSANIVHADQHQDATHKLFFMRVEFELQDFALDDANFRRAFKPLAERLQAQWRLEYSTSQPKVALFVSKYLHCLVDLLHRQQLGELRCQIALIVSNHQEAQPLAGYYGIPFHHVPVTKENKEEAESAQLELMRQHGVDLIVLARYMQVLSPRFVSEHSGRIINVHHSFLPAFTGAKPYHAAFERGVKLIGATSHYVTDELDEGPIIEQDVSRISHRYQVEDLVECGRDLERLVLSRAVKWHLEHRILCYANKTVVFD